MSEVTSAPQTSQRKADHIRINLEEAVQFPRLTTSLEQYTFRHQALPELDLAKIDTQTSFLGKALSAPILISCMTGGTDEAREINRNLALAAQEVGVAMGLGSQRAAIEDESLAASYQVRDLAPDILLFANLGAVQLNYGYGVGQCQRAVDMIEADALVLHLNVLQEAVQPEGDGNFSGLLHKIEQICQALPVPVIAKEVGWGISEETARLLQNTGVQVIDVAGAGGTSWSEVEYHRAPSSFHAEVARSFADWGIPTAHSLIYARRGAPGLPLIASGGLRNGIDIAKCVALGAGLCGLAGPFLRAGVESVDAVLEFEALLEKQLRVAMFAAGAANIPVLWETPLYPVTDIPMLDYT